jgi:hypothetical protein
MAAMVEQGGEDQANSGIERRDRSKVEPKVSLRDAVVKAQHGAAQTPQWASPVSRCRARRWTQKAAVRALRVVGYLGPGRERHADSPAGAPSLE